MSDFGSQLRAAREAVKLSRKSLAARVHASNTEIGFWETGTRVPSPERQAELIAACVPPSSVVKAIVEPLERDILARLAEFADDLETTMQHARKAEAESVTAAVAGPVLAGLPTRPARRRKPG